MDYEFRTNSLEFQGQGIPRTGYLFHLNPPDQLAHHFAHLRGRIAADDFDVADAGAAEGFAFYGVAGGGVFAHVVAFALEFHRVERPAFPSTISRSTRLELTAK